MEQVPNENVCDTGVAATLTVKILNAAELKLRDSSVRENFDMALRSIISDDSNETRAWSSIAFSKHNCLVHQRSLIFTVLPFCFAAACQRIGLGAELELEVRVPPLRGLGRGSGANQRGLERDAPSACLS